MSGETTVFSITNQCKHNMQTLCFWKLLHKGKNVHFSKPFFLLG